MDLSNDCWRRYGLWCAMGAFIATRALVLAIAYLAPQDRSPNRIVGVWSAVPTVRWDAGHYSKILQEGYPLENGGIPSPPKSDTIAFFPAFPFLARLLTPWVGPEAALVVFNQAASLLAMIFVYWWARGRYDGRVAFWCVVLLSVYPPALFFSAGYADGLLVLCVALALWLLERQWIWAAAAVSALATATRPNGLCLAIIIVLWFVLYGPRPAWPRRREATAPAPAKDCTGLEKATAPAALPAPIKWRQERAGWAPWLLRLTAIGFVSTAGLLAFELYLWHHYGRPDAFLAVQKTWQPRPEAGRPLLGLITLRPVLHPASRPIRYAIKGLFYLAVLRPEASRKAFDEMFNSRGLNAFFNLAIVVLAIVGLRRPGRVPRVLFLLPILVFLQAYLPDPYRGSRMAGIARYQLIALPVFLLLASWLAQPRLARFGCFLCLVLLAIQCFNTSRFVNWIVVG